MVESKLELAVGTLLAPFLLVTIPIVKESVNFADTYARGEYLTIAGAVLSTLIVGQIIRLVKHEGGIPTGVHLFLCVLLACFAVTFFAGRLSDEGEFVVALYQVRGVTLDSSATLLLASAVMAFTAPPLKDISQGQTEDGSEKVPAAVTAAGPHVPSQSTEGAAP